MIQNILVRLPLEVSGMDGGGGTQNNLFFIFCTENHPLDVSLLLFASLSAKLSDRTFLFLR